MHVLWKSFMCNLRWFGVAKHVWWESHKQNHWSKTDSRKQLLRIAKAQATGNNTRQLIELESFGYIASYWSHCVMLVTLCHVGHIVSYWSHCIMLVTLCNVGHIVSGWSHCSILVTLRQVMKQTKKDFA